MIYISLVGKAERGKSLWLALVSELKPVTASDSRAAGSCPRVIPAVAGSVNVARFLGVHTCKVGTTMQLPGSYRFNIIYAKCVAVLRKRRSRCWINAGYQVTTNCNCYRRKDLLRAQ